MVESWLGSVVGLCRSTSIRTSRSSCLALGADGLFEPLIDAFLNLRSEKSFKTAKPNEVHSSPEWVLISPVPKLEDVRYS